MDPKALKRWQLHQQEVFVKILEQEYDYSNLAANKLFWFMAQQGAFDNLNLQAVADKTRFAAEQMATYFPFLGSD